MRLSLVLTVVLSFVIRKCYSGAGGLRMVAVFEVDCSMLVGLG
jgi:hypothetical protein